MKKLQTANGSMTRSYTVGNDSGQLPPGQYRAFFNGDFNNFGTLPATYKIGTSGLTTDVQKDIRKEQLTTSADGWNYAVDQDRKFWKDDFSSDTSGNYTLNTGTYTISNGRLYTTTDFYTNIQISNFSNDYSFIVSADMAISSIQTGSSATYVRFQFGNGNALRIGALRNNLNSGVDLAIYDYSTMTSVKTIATGKNINLNEYFNIKISYDSRTSEWNVYYNNVLYITVIYKYTFSGIQFLSMFGNSIVDTWSILPSISYSDSLTSNTSARYQTVSGSNAFSTDKLNLTAPAGTWNKTRLKSYKFESGKTTQKIVLPITGTAGDIVAHYFAGSADMSMNYGIGVKRLASNLWLPVEIKDNVVITTGTSPIAPIQDGDTVNLEVETDMVKGVSWLSVWNDGSKNIMTLPYASTKYVNLGANYSSNSIFSIFVKFRTNLNCGRYGTLISNGDFATNVGGFTLGYTDRTVDKKLMFYLDNYLAYKKVVSTIDVSDDVWNTAVITYSNGIMKLYINGIYNSTATYTLTTNTYSLLMGKTSFGNTSVYAGEIPSVIIYNSLLSDADIQKLHNGVLINSEIGYYVNTGNTDSDWVDRSGNNNNGTVYGTPATTAITGSKLQGTTLKQFANYSYGYSGTGYYNAGASSNNCSLKLLESRARSLLGYTNVQVIENINFIDDFNENSINRYNVVAAGTPSISNGSLLMRSSSSYCTLYTNQNICYGDGTYIYKCKNLTSITGDAIGIWICSSGTITSSSYYAPPNCYGIYISVNSGDSYNISIKKMINGVLSSLNSANITLITGDEHTVKIIKYGNSIQVYVNNVLVVSATDNTFTTGYITLRSTAVTSGTIASEFTNISFTGTRNTYKPMLRGAGVGSYYDGTQEVSCARFTDDFENNSLSEYGNNTNFTYDSVNKYIIHNNVVTTNGLQVTPQFNDGWYEVKVTTASADTTRIAFCNSTTSLQVGGGTKYLVVLSTNDNKLSVSRDVSGVTSVLYSLSNAGIAPNTTYTVNIYKLNGIIKIYINNNLLINITDDSPITTVGNFVIGGMTSIGVKIHHINVISINGLFLGGISHGGFFLNDGNPNNSGNWAGFQFQNHDRDTIYTSTLNRGACPVADSSSFQIIRKNVTDNSQISSKSITEDISVTTSTATISTNDITLNADDIGDDIGIYIQTKNDNAPILPLVSQSLIRNSLTDTTSNNYYFVDFDIDEADIGKQIQIGLFENDQVSDRYFKLNYMLMSPTELIEWNAKRSLIDLNETISVDKI